MCAINFQSIWRSAFVYQNLFISFSEIDLPYFDFILRFFSDYTSEIRILITWWHLKLLFFNFCTFSKKIRYSSKFNGKKTTYITQTVEVEISAKFSFPKKIDWISKRESVSVGRIPPVCILYMLQWPPPDTAPVGGPRVNKFEQVSSDGHQMSVLVRAGGQSKGQKGCGRESEGAATRVRGGGTALSSKESWVINSTNSKKFPRIVSYGYHQRLFEISRSGEFYFTDSLDWPKLSNVQFSLKVCLEW